MGKTFVVGDIHGAHKALIQVLERSGFDKSDDTLICLGDVCDGWPETYEVIEELLTISNLILLLGNHDTWFKEWLESGSESYQWQQHGGIATMQSYRNKQPSTHLELMNRARHYFLDNDRLFVHAGVRPWVPLEQQTETDLIWDRTLPYLALEQHRDLNLKVLTQFKEVYIGHTPVSRIGCFEPLKSGEVWLMDTGAGWNGVLSMMNIDTYKVFVSDFVPTLYPDHGGRMSSTKNLRQR